MKKRFSILAAAVVYAACVLAGCGETEEEDTTNVEMQTYEDWISDASDSLEVFPDFTATDLDGNTVTQEIRTEMGKAK